MTEQTKNTEYLFQQAVQQHREGRLEQAAKTYGQCLAETPNHAESLFNLATVYAQLGQWFSAVECYKQSLKQFPEAPKILYNLSIALLNTEQFGEAIVNLQKVVAISPRHGEAQHLLASMLHQTGNFQEAKSHYEAALAVCEQELDQVHFNYAVLLMHLAEYPLAKHHLKEAIDSSPNFAEANYNLGVVEAYCQNYDEAIAHLEQATQAKEKYFEAHYQLVFLYKKLGQLDAALMHCQRALAIKPNSTLSFMTSLLEGTSCAEVTPELPQAFITDLFDQYSSNYDAHLVEYLHYALPGELETMLPSYCQKKSESALDLGCGTGLAGEVLKPYSKYLVGVDLSAEMLKCAQKKQIYDDMACQDIVEFLSVHQSMYSLILAADVFAYLTDLETVFSVITPRLMTNGLLVFSIEETDQPTPYFSKELRYQYSDKFITTLLSSAGLHRLENKRIILRKHNDNAIAGRLYICRKVD